MRVPAEAAELEALARQIREASAASLEAEMFERWGPRDDFEQRAALERRAAEGEAQRRAAIAGLEQRVPELRSRAAGVVEAWADAHIELLDAYLGVVAADSTEAFVAKQEREAWAKLRAGEGVRVEQNTFYVRYDYARYRELFGV